MWFFESHGRSALHPWKLEESPQMCRTNRGQFPLCWVSSGRCGEQGSGFSYDHGVPLAHSIFRMRAGFPVWWVFILVISIIKSSVLSILFVLGGAESFVGWLWEKKIHVIAFGRKLTEICKIPDTWLTALCGQHFLNKFQTIEMLVWKIIVCLFEWMLLLARCLFKTNITDKLLLGNDLFYSDMHHNNVKSNMKSKTFFSPNLGFSLESCLKCSRAIWLKLD